MNAYEIRLQVMLTAKEMLMEKYRNELSHKQSKDVPLPTSAEILKLANDLYVFVNEKRV